MLTAVARRFSEARNVELQQPQGIPSPNMPSWWTPEKRFAWRIVGIGDASLRFGSLAEAQEYCEPEEPGDRGIDPRNILRITADPETGEEVPA